MQRFTGDHTQRLRRVPQQSRSRDRVERILDTAAAQVVHQGVEALGTRGIADAAGVPVASLYQYFADKDDILLALVERDLAAMDRLITESAAALDRLTIRSLVQATIDAFVRGYRQRPSFVVVWLRGRTNPAIAAYCREHNRRIAVSLFEQAAQWGLFAEPADACHVEIALDVADRLFEKAFEDDVEGDPVVLGETRKVVTAYLELYASAAGRHGVAVPAQQHQHQAGAGVEQRLA